MNVLLVAVRLDAMVLEREINVVEAAADFGRLPYPDPVTGRDVNPRTPYLGHEILPVPFEDENLRLRPGTHLHWTLPDALTRIVQRDGRAEVRSVPNRWLVTRTKDGAVERQWVVESDFAGTTGDGVTYPVPAPVPFRRLGRTLPLAAWPTAPRGESIAGLSAVGYGEPAFAAFYPNCHGVFGLYDPEQAGPGTAYDLLGWWDDTGQDPVARAVRDKAWKERLKTDLSWIATDVPAGKTGPPVRAVCHARLRFEPEEAAGSDDIAGVYVGTTATEALAAHLGTVLPGRDARQIENLLEAIAFAGELESKPVDVGIGLQEARHGAGFRRVPGGALWTVRRDDAPDPTPGQRQRRAVFALPHRIGDLLNALNATQEDHDRAAEALAGHRAQLFADWSRYQRCAYPEDGPRDDRPDPDLVRHYLERQMADIGSGTATLERLATAVASAGSALDQDLAEISTTADCASVFARGTVAAPAYHQPAEPVVLLTGDLARPSERYGADGELACPVVDLPGLADPGAARAALAAHDHPVTVWRGDPWHPVLLQWQAEFYPVAAGTNLGADDHTYDPAYITGNHVLGPVDLAPAPGRDGLKKAANVYTGTTLLSDRTQPVLADRILRYLASAILEKTTTEAFLADPGPELTRYAEHGKDERLTTLIEVYRHLAAHERDNLAQSLGGFNDALVMRRLVRQLPIADPLGFPEYQAFAARVAAAVGGDTRQAPHPDSDFNPIRSGALRISRLRVVDSFGRAREIPVEDLATTTRLRIPGRPGWVAMPPRLTQPARLSARWLDSDHDLRHMNDVPVTSPVCGWLVPDDLDAGFAVYDAGGARLGVLQAAGAEVRWTPGPGGTTLERVVDPHLRETVQGLMALGAADLGLSLAGVDRALAGVEPDDHGAPLLTGRPLALVRAEFELRLHGLPAVHQDWNVFRQDLHRTGREDDAFPLVRFPVRIGAADRLDDGLVALWDGAALTSGDIGLELVLDQPHRLTLLVDPRAPVHVTSGILPGKALRLPPAQYQPALDGMTLAFFAAPVLTDGDRLDLPVPSVPGHHWAWQEVGLPDADLDDARPGTAFPDPPVLREGWLALVPGPDEGTR